MSVQRGKPRPKLDRSDPIALLQMGDQLRTRGDYLAAEPLLLEALQILERTQGKRHLDTAVALNSLGVLYKYVGRFAAASRAYRRALRTVERAAAATPHDAQLISFLSTLNHNLGGLEHARRRFARGEPFARRSVELRRTIVSDGDDPDLAADEAALAALLDGQGKYDESEPLYRHALAVFERRFGPEHYEVAVNLNNLAAVRQLRGDLATAEKLYHRAMAIKEKLLGQRHPDVAVTLHNLAVLAHETGQRSKAARLFRRCIGIFRKTLTANHPNLLAAEWNCARLLLQHGFAAVSPILNSRR